MNKFFAKIFFVLFIISLVVILSARLGISLVKIEEEELILAEPIYSYEINIENNSSEIDFIKKELIKDKIDHVYDFIPMPLEDKIFLVNYCYQKNIDPDIIFALF